MALRGLRSALGRGGEQPASSPAGTPAQGGTAQTGAPTPGMTYTRGGYVPVRSFNAATTGPQGSSPATPGGTQATPGSTPAAAPGARWGQRPPAAAGPSAGNPTSGNSGFGNPATGIRVQAGWSPVPPADAAAPADAGPQAPGDRAATRAGGPRMVLGVAAGKAAQLIGAGAVAGFIVGAVLVGVALPRQPAVAGSPGAGTASVAPFVVPGDAAAALRGTTTLNGRLAGEADALSTALAAKAFPVNDVVRVMRRMTINVRAASAMVSSLGDWPDAAAQQAALSAFYDELTTEIDDALAQSVTNAGAYQAATQRIMTTLAKVRDLDTEARALAAGADITLPDVTIPDSLPG